MGFLATNDMVKGQLSGNKHVLTNEETAKLKETVLEITKEIVLLCEENNIEYMLGGGSALGAIRHKGFIPWDDDIDINVPRKHIDKLVNLVKEKYPDKYYIEVPIKTEGYLSSFVQIHKRGTIFKENSFQEDDKCGIKLDIFPIENTYDNPILRKLHGWQVEFGLLMLSCYRMYVWKEHYMDLAGDNKKARAILSFKGFLGMLYSPFEKKGYNRIQKTMSKCKKENSKYVVMPSGRRHFFGELYERNPFMTTIKVPFEDTEFRVTKDYDNYLRKLYGDYMTIPKANEREHHVLLDIKF